MARLGLRPQGSTVAESMKDKGTLTDSISTLRPLRPSTLRSTQPSTLRHPRPIQSNTLRHRQFTRFAHSKWSHRRVPVPRSSSSTTPMRTIEAEVGNSIELAGRSAKHWSAEPTPLFPFYQPEQTVDTSIDAVDTSFDTGRVVPYSPVESVRARESWRIRTSRTFWSGSSSSLCGGRTQKSPCHMAELTVIKHLGPQTMRRQVSI